MSQLNIKQKRNLALQLLRTLNLSKQRKQEQSEQLLVDDIIFNELQE